MSGQATGAADIVNIKCNCCGRMMPSKPIAKTIRGKPLRFCSQDCVKLYISYKLKKNRA